ncbi:MAG: hypothetical protein V1726_00330 [Methanobacteriota archaeon]
MRKKNGLRFFAISEIALLITFGLMSTLVAGHIIPPPICLTAKPQVRIDELEIYEFTDPLFEIHTLIVNHDYSTVNITIRHIMIYPDGEREQQSWYQGTMYGGNGFEFWILCAYTDNQFGKYTWIVTVTQDSNGMVLDQEKITWEREPIP